MSAHIIDGVMGAGKGLYLINCIKEQLLNHDRYIITNLPVNFGELQKTLDKYSDGIDVNDRVRVLNHEETKRFWCMIEDGKEVPFYESTDWMKLTGDQIHEHYGKYTKSYCYLIDEAGRYVNSEDWKVIGRQVIDFVAMIRQLNGSIVCFASQDRAEIAKPLRRKIQDYTRCRNLGKERKGWFRLPKLFQRTISSDFGGVAIQDVREYRIDLEWAKCYNTTGAVGIHERKADQKEKLPGVHWAWALGGFVLLIVFMLFGGPEYFLKKALLKPSRPSAPMAPAVTNAPVAKAKPQMRHNKNQSAVDGRLVIEAETPAEPLNPAGSSSRTQNAGWPVGNDFGVWLVGASKNVEQFHVYLSDGRSYESGDGHLQKIGPNWKWCVIDGVIYRTFQGAPQKSREEAPPVPNSEEHKQSASVVYVPPGGWSQETYRPLKIAEFGPSPWGPRSVR